MLFSREDSTWGRKSPICVQRVIEPLEAHGYPLSKWSCLYCHLQLTCQTKLWHPLDACALAYYVLVFIAARPRFEPAHQVCQLKVSGYDCSEPTTPKWLSSSRLGWLAQPHLLYLHSKCILSCPEQRLTNLQETNPPNLGRSHRKDWVHLVLWTVAMLFSFRVFNLQTYRPCY